MRTLVIETASEACSIALFEGGEIITHDHRVIGRGHAEALVPMIGALPEKGRAARILVSLGPGSFTGVRIGVATAKGLSLARGTKMVGVTTSRVLARAASGEVRAVVIDAKKDEVFVSVYRATSTGLALLLVDVHGSPRDVAAQLAQLSAKEGPLTLLGSALVPHGETFRAALPTATFLPQVFSAPRGDVLALEAMETFAARGADDPSALVPIYVRGADAKLPGGISL